MRTKVVLAAFSLVLASVMLSSCKDSEYSPFVVWGLAPQDIQDPAIAYEYARLDAEAKLRRNMDVFVRARAVSSLIDHKMFRQDANTQRFMEALKVTITAGHLSGLVEGPLEKTKHGYRLRLAISPESVAKLARKSVRNALIQNESLLRTTTEEAIKRLDEEIERYLK